MGGFEDATLLPWGWGRGRKPRGDSRGALKEVEKAGALQSLEGTSPLLRPGQTPDPPNCEG